MRYCVLIPAHNEAGTIRQVVEGALCHVDHVIVVNDGSTDETVAALDGVAIELLDHAENRGKGQRLSEGIDHAIAAGFDGVLTLDADMQHDPDDIPAFLAAAQADPEAFILGDRFSDNASMPRGRAFGIRFGDFFVGWSIERRLRDAQCGMRLYPASLWKRTAVPDDLQAHFVFETAVLLHAAEAGCRFVRVPIAARYSGFVSRPSHYRPFTDTWSIVCAITKFIVRRRFKLRGLLIAVGLLR
ncbi:MAG: glycosyltransferase family 2 protein [Pseudomonadota bacterium]